MTAWLVRWSAVLRTALAAFAGSVPGSAHAQTPVEAEAPRASTASFAPAPFVVRPHLHGPTRRGILAARRATVLHFGASCASDEARALFDQGLTQLHAFEHAEAERSFRQVVALEPSCAIAWWGAALANPADPQRARYFVEAAVAWRDRASARERSLIDALAACLEVTPESAIAAVQDPTRNLYALPALQFVGPESERHTGLRAELERLLTERPDDLEIAALFAHQGVLDAHAGRLGADRDATLGRVRSALDHVLAKNARHPALALRLHLDVLGDRAGALRAAGLAGLQAGDLVAPWCLSGRLLTGLHRPEDALWHYDAARRTAHARMLRERAMPFDVEGYGDAAVGYAECLARLGRVREALAWLEHVVADQPRHPARNDLADPGSLVARAAARFAALCIEYRLRDELAAWRSAGRPGTAADDTAAAVAGDAHLAALAAADALLAAGRARDAAANLAAEDRARPDRVATLVRLAEACARDDRTGSGAEVLGRLRRLAGHADLDHPFFAPVAELAAAAGLPADWRLPRDELLDWPRDIGPRPQPEPLGPDRWTPPTPYEFTLPTADGTRYALREHRGEPLLVVMYLGFG
ncbi:MAG: hypothetical protein IPM29_25525 [Planctomycetes bacterium]|nr:hypothetical protein [Planctomycetota bacterium]